MTSTVDAASSSWLHRQTGMRLRDGRRVRLRPLRPDDEPAVKTLFATADPGDLRRRFLGQPPPLVALSTRLTTGDGVHDLALGAFDDAGRVVAIAQFDRPDDRPSAEFAIEVAGDWQNDHLGTVMIRRLAAIARSVGIERFTAIFFADNLPIQRLLKHSGDVSATSYAAGEGFITLDLASM